MMSSSCYSENISHKSRTYFRLEPKIGQLTLNEVSTLWMKVLYQFKTNYANKNTIVLPCVIFNNININPVNNAIIISRTIIIISRGSSGCGAVSPAATG